MQISVAMCTYNGSRFLPEQLASIRAQTLLPFELVICDDGSTDTTPELVSEFARTVPFPVRFVRNERNLGSTKNFEKAIGLCKGELVALCDQDDTWMPRKLEVLSQTLEADPTSVGAFSDAELMDEDGAPEPGTLWSTVHFGPRERRQFERGQTFFLTRRPLVTGACFIFRASLAYVFTPIPAEHVHDGWMALCLSTRGQLRAVPDKLIRYRLHNTQQLGIRGVSKREALQRSREARVRFHREGAERYRLAASKLAGIAGAARSARYAAAKAVYMEKRACLLERGRLPRVVRGLSILPGHFHFAWGPVSYVRDLLHG